MRLLGAIAFVWLSGCVYVDDFGAKPDAPDCVCHARNGGESDHVGGDHWFNGPEFCACDSVAGAPTTSCRDVCSFTGVRFVDSDGVVCSCSASGATSCSADANENGTCSDGDGDGICDG